MARIPASTLQIGDLRLRISKSLNSTWRSRNSAQYSPACIGYGPSQIDYDVSEDCLYLNIIKSSNTKPSKHSKLPVAGWIHGGGFVQGSGIDKRYNLSFIVRESVHIGTPILGITPNYRLGAWGFPALLTSTPKMDESFADQLLAAYPDAPAEQVLANLPPSFRSGAAAGLSAYCYRFNAISAWAEQLQGATHFVEVAVSMLTLGGEGYAPVRVPPFQGKPESYAELARLMSGDSIGFVASGKDGGRERARRFGVPKWPVYGVEGPRNFVYDANMTSFVESDTYRKQGMELTSGAALDVYGR